MTPNTSTHTCTHTYTHTRAHTHTQTHTHTHTHAHTRTHICTHTHTHTMCTHDPKRFHPQQVHDNPISRSAAYAATLHATLPFLTELDGQPVSGSQRARNVAVACCSSPYVILAGPLSRADVCVCVCDVRDVCVLPFE